MGFTDEIQAMTYVGRCTVHGPAPIPQEGEFERVTDCSQVSAFSHSVGTCAPQQGACKLTLNVKRGVIQEALVEVVGCSGMTHSAAMAAEILPGRTLVEALNTDLVCDAINVAMRNMFLALVYGRSQSAFSKDGLPLGAALEDLGSDRFSQVGTSYGTVEKGPRYLATTEGYIQELALDKKDRIIGYKFVRLGEMMKLIAEGTEVSEAFEQSTGIYGRFSEAVRFVNPRKE